MSEFEGVFRKRVTITSLHERTLEVKRIKEYRKLIPRIAHRDHIDQQIDETIHDLIQLARDRIIKYDRTNL